MATTVSRPYPSASSWDRHLRWFVAGAGAAFLVPFVFSSLLELHHDLYLAIYYGFVIGLMTLYVRQTQIDVRELLSRPGVGASSPARWWAYQLCATCSMKPSPPVR